MRVTVNDIAKEMNIAQGTVSKALNGRPGVSEKLRKEILEMADKMGFRPNLAARALSRKSITLGAILLTSEPYFTYHEPVAQGIALAFSELQDFNVKSVIKPIPLGKHEFMQAVQELLDLVVSGIIYAVTDQHMPILEEMTKGKKLPCVFISATHSDCFTVSHNARRAGELAGEYLGSLCPAGSRFAIFTSNISNDMLCDIPKVEGFREQLLLAGHCEPAIYNTYNDPEEAERIMRYLGENQFPDGIYVSTANWKPVCKYLQENPQYRPHLVITDAAEEMEPFAQAHIIDAVIHQYPVEQGYQAAMRLYEHCSAAVPFPDQPVPPLVGKYLVDPSLLLRCNYRDHIKPFAGRLL